MRVLLLLLACAGCSTVLGIDDLSGPLASDAAGDSPPTPPDGPVVPPGGILIAGSVLTANLDGVAGAVVELLDQPEGIPTASAVSGGNGTFQLVIDAMGNQFDGSALRVSAPVSSLATLAYFAQPLSPDLAITDARLQLFEEGSFEKLAARCGLPQSPFKSAFIVFTVDEQGAPAPNTPFTTSPTAPFCTERNGAFEPTTDTGPTGVAFAFELPPGSVTVSSSSQVRSGRSEINTVTEVTLIPSMGP